MQAIRVEHSCYNFPSDHKRRCYGEDQDSSLSDPSVNSNDEDQGLGQEPEPFSHSLVDRNLLHPGELD